MFEGGVGPGCLVVLNATTGKAEQTYPAASGPTDQGDHAWSPDGSAFVYHTKMGLAATKAAPISGAKGRIGEVHWSTGGLVWIGVDGHLHTHARRLTSGVGQDQSFSFSRDGRWIAYVRFPDPNAAGNLYVIPSSGGKPRLVQRTVSLDDPAWSPDGRQIAFGRYANGLQIFVAPVTGGKARAITKAESSGPVWSPDGKWIAYAGTGLHVVRPDGSGDRRLAPGSIETIDWSPSSKQLAFATSSGAVEVVDADGTHLRRLAP